MGNLSETLDAKPGWLAVAVALGCASGVAGSIDADCVTPWRAPPYPTTTTTHHSPSFAIRTDGALRSGSCLFSGGWLGYTLYYTRAVYHTVS